MMRTFLAVLAGLIVMFVSVAAIEMIGIYRYPPPLGLDVNDARAMNAWIATLPVAALAIVVAAWAVGAFAGAWTAARLSRRHALPSAMIVGVTVLVATATNFFQFAHPAWMMLAGLALPLPLAWLGYRLASAKREPEQDREWRGGDR
ncbi:hypothetical protein [Arenimonas sp.]|uniref:hypothetical protein n=1 Tax=Arenimonas sp. TaxID=1872635 RepID=UPI0039E65061